VGARRKNDRIRRGGERGGRERAVQPSDEERKKGGGVADTLGVPGAAARGKPFNLL